MILQKSTTANFWLIRLKKKVSFFHYIMSVLRESLEHRERRQEGVPKSFLVKSQAMVPWWQGQSCRHQVQVLTFYNDNEHASMAFIKEIQIIQLIHRLLPIIAMHTEATEGLIEKQNQNRTETESIKAWLN